MAKQVEYLEELQIAIRFKHHCQPTHQESVFVHEMAGNGETAWKGNVEVFGLTGHKDATTCYAWLNQKGNGVEILTVLGSHFVDSPRRAIQAAIFTGAQHAFSMDKAVYHKQLEEIKKTLQETRIKSEDLEAAIQAARQTKEDIDKKRKKT